MRILIVANNLSQGGIQTSLLNLLKVISKDLNVEIDLFLFSDKSDLKKEIPQNINVIVGHYLLKLTAMSFKEVIATKKIVDIIIRGILIIIARICKPKKYFKLLFRREKNNKKYDYAISYFNDIPSSYFNKGATYYVLNNTHSSKKVGWIHTDIEKAKFNIQYYKDEYNDFDYIINVSKHCKEVYDKLIPEQKNKTFVVYNFFDIEGIRKKSLEMQNTIVKENNKTIFITVARIDNISKRIDKIIKIADRLVKENIKNFVWYIVGNGPDYYKIKQEINLRKLEDYIILLGSKQNPYPYIKAADMFILTSDFEGFPMVVGESLCLEVPVLTTNYDSAKEQISDGFNGFIVNNDENDIYQKIKKILRNNKIITELKNNIKKNTISNDIAKQQFYNVFGETDE